MTQQKATANLKEYREGPVTVTVDKDLWHVHSDDSKEPGEDVPFSDELCDQLFGGQGGWIRGPYLVIEAVDDPEHPTRSAVVKVAWDTEKKVWVMDQATIF